LINIQSRGSLADYVKAEIKDAELEKTEMAFTWREEMEPVLSTPLEPGLELSRAYRYIRSRHWRKAIIYMDHLEQKYPNWNDLFFAKALAFEGMHEMPQALRAYAKACERGHRQACTKVSSATPED
jgi:tetratricopeptide (TPR) repeat protein